MGEDRLGGRPAGRPSPAFYGGSPDAPIDTPSTHHGRPMRGGGGRLVGE